MQALRSAGAELVVLDLGERDLGSALESRQQERLGVGLLELLQAALAEVLEHLLAVGVPVQEGGHRRAGVPGHQREQCVGDVHLVVDPAQHGTRGLAQLALEATLDRPAKAQQLGVPLVVTGTVVEAPVVQLVEDPQGELDVGVRGHGLGAQDDGRRGRPSAPGASEHREHVAADGTTWLGEAASTAFRAVKSIEMYPADGRA